MNIIDYLVWRGDIPFSLDPINEVDYLILSDFIYCDFDGLFVGNRKLTIKELSNAYFLNEKNLKLLDNSVSLSDSARLLKHMSETKRFKDLLVHNYVSLLHDFNNEQFAALTIDISYNESIIVFRGTDDSITGWVEDFEMSFKEVESQKDAIKYVSENIGLFKKYVLLGHSKGGNLALYSAIHVNDRISKRIKKIISLDGPGLINGTFSEEKFNLMKDKFIKYSPSYAVVGSIFDNRENRIIVKANEKGFKQHFIHNWQIEGNRIIRENKIEEDAILFNKALDGFISKTSLDERKIFVEELSNALRKADVDTISDITSGDVKQLISIVGNIVSTSKEAKDIANLFFREFVDVFGSDIVDTLKDFVDEISNSIKKLI